MGPVPAHQQGGGEAIPARGPIQAANSVTRVSLPICAEATPFGGVAADALQSQLVPMLQSLARYMMASRLHSLLLVVPASQSLTGTHCCLLQHSSPIQQLEYYYALAYSAAGVLLS